MSRKCDPRLRRRIVREAEHLIHLRGYHCTSLDDIAARCKMTKANLFHHFRSKEDLGLAVLEYKVGSCCLDCLAPLAPSTDPVKAVGDLFSKASCFFKGNGCKAGCLMGNIALEMSDINDRFRRRASAFFEDWTSTWRAFFYQAKSRGEFDSDFNPGQVAESILAMYEGAIMLARSRRDPAVFERVGRQARQLLISHRLTKNGGVYGT